MLEADREKFGAWLVALRGQRTRRSIARAADISDSYLRQIERGYQEVRGVRLYVNPSPEVLASLADALGVDRDEMARRSEVTLPPAEESSSVEAITKRLHALIDQLAEAKVAGG